MPFLEELGYIPTEKYAGGTEIFAHCPERSPGTSTSTRTPPSPTLVHQHRVGRGRRSVGDPHQPGRRDEGQVRLPGGRHPAPSEAPGIPGIDDYKGHSFHTSRWDYAYTGGDTNGRLDQSAGQAGRHHRHGRHRHPVRPAPGPVPPTSCYVFQRTPSTVDERNNKPTDPTWAASLEPGWQKKRMRELHVDRVGHPPGRGSRQRPVDRRVGPAVEHAGQHGPGRRPGRGACRWPTT